jgi:hypothetical protein
MDIDLNAPEVKAAIEAEAKKLADAEAGGLKKKTNELMDELKDLKRKYDGVDPEDYRKLKDTKRKEGDDKASPEELRKKIEAEFSPLVEKEKQRGDAAESKLKSLLIDNALTTALTEANIGKDFMKAAKALVQTSNKFDVTESGATVDGQPVADFIKKWVEGEGKAFVAAPANSGGGANGGKSGSGAAGKQKRSEMTASEKSAYVTQHGREAFLALPA